MKTILVALLSMMSLPAFAVSVTQLTCTTIGHEATVRVQFGKSIDPLNPWIGWNRFSGALSVQPQGSAQIYKVDLEFSPIDGKLGTDLRGDSPQQVYLQLYPQVVNGQATGRYTGQLFVNDLDARAYFNFRNEGSEPGLVCR